MLEEEMPGCTIDELVRKAGIVIVNQEDVRTEVVSIPTAI